MKQSQIIMLIGSLLLGSLFFLPMWNITLEAPQYPDPIGMDIYINKFEGANPNDIKNINIMNHYVGMKDIPETIPEFSLFPWFAGGMLLLGVILAFIGKSKLYLVWFGLMIVLGSLAMYDFYLWEYDYGHDLKETAAIKFTDEKGEPMAYQPPLIGNKMILNFKALSWPRMGAYLMFAGMALAVVAYYLSKKESFVKANAILMLGLMLFSTSCEVKPQKITYGEEGCHFCRMTIVDKQHAAQIVTVKGKAYKYDAIECMMNHMKDWDLPDIAIILAADYENPGELIDATKAHYLISEGIPSPMGEYLTAFKNQGARDETRNEMEGESLSWDQLVIEFDKKN